MDNNEKLLLLKQLVDRRPGPLHSDMSSVEEKLLDRMCFLLHQVPWLEMTAWLASLDADLALFQEVLFSVCLPAALSAVALSRGDPIEGMHFEGDDKANGAVAIVQGGHDRVVVWTFPALRH